MCPLRVSGRRLGRGELQKASKSWEGFRCTKAIDRIRYRLPLSVQGVISYRITWAAHLSPQLQKSLHRRGRVVLVVVVGVGEDGPSLLEKAVHDLRPPSEVLVAFLLEVRVSLRELSPVTQPADVGEVSRRLLHPGHPRIVDERQGHASLSKHLGEI